MKQVIQRICKQQWGKEVELEEITDCFGCITENKPLFVGCLSCEIRACARKKNIENCAHCPDYVCETLNQFLLKNSESKARLDVINSIV